MEKLGEYFLYNKDYSVINDIFYSLYRQLEIIHENNMFVPNIDASHILVDDGFKFDTMSFSSNIDLDRRKNIVALTKLFLGTALSLETGFMDFSSIDTQSLVSNLDMVAQNMSSDLFPNDYFFSVLHDGENIYYNDYLDRQREEAELNSRSRVDAYKKVLSNAGSKLYEDQASLSNEDGYSNKSAFINLLFYPVLISCLVIVVFVIYTCIGFIVK